MDSFNFDVGALPFIPQAGDDPQATLAPLAVVLDLDHTLVLSQEGEELEGYDFTFKRGSQVVSICKRPGLDEFLSWLRQSSVEVSVYTAASESYADAVTSFLDPDGVLFCQTLTRRDCLYEPPAKDLTKITTNLQRVVLVDDSLASMRLQPDNGILVTPFTTIGATDTELQRVCEVLESLLEADDVQQVLKARFGLKQQIAWRAQECANQQDLHALWVSGLSISEMNGKYVRRQASAKAAKAAKFLYVQQERPQHRIVWSVRGHCWVMDDGTAKRYRYAALRTSPSDAPADTQWTRCNDDDPLPLPIVRRYLQEFPAAAAQNSLLNRTVEGQASDGHVAAQRTCAEEVPSFVGGIVHARAGA